MIDYFRHIHMEPELACEFMAVFSRMEYALKAAGYAMDAGGKVAANWDRFSNDIDKGFSLVEDPSFGEAVGYLLSRPPGKQVLDGNAIGFVEQKIDENQAKAQQVLLMVRTVRNNLFHGGKHYPDGESEPGRNQNLVRYSLVVLKQSAKLSDEVRLRYEH